jgi:dienelactone hydrolase
MSVRPSIRPWTTRSFVRNRILRAEDISVASTIVIVHGAALAVLVGADGPAPWPALRALVVMTLTAGAVRATRGMNRRRTSATLLAFGLVGVIAGGAIGVGHLLKVGLCVEGVSGGIALVTGLMLVAMAATALVRRARRWRKLLAVPFGLALTILVVAPLTLAVFVTNVPPLVLGKGTPANFGLAYEDVTLYAGDGVRLAGWYVPSTNGAAVVLLAGATSTRSDELDHAAVLARHGFGVLLLDVRGHGDSGGDAMIWGWHGDVDVRAAVDYLTTRSDVTDERIGVVGMSMGGEEAIGAAGADTRIKAVMVEGVSARGARDEGDPATGAGGWLIRYIDWATRHAADLMTSAKPPPKLRDAVAATAPRPIMIIAAGTQPPEIAAARVFQAAAPDSVELWIAPGAGHTEAYDVHPVDWETRVVDFLDRTLLAGSTTSAQ